MKCARIRKVKEQEDKDLHLKEQGLLSFGAAKILLNEYRGNQLILKLKNLPPEKRITEVRHGKQHFTFI